MPRLNLYYSLAMTSISAPSAPDTSVQGKPEHIIALLAEELGVKPPQVAAAIELLDGGATVPFIARYRKEATG